MNQGEERNFHLKIFDNISVNELLSGKNSYLNFENKKLNKEVDRLNKIFVLRIYHFLRKKFFSRIFVDTLESFFNELLPTSSREIETINGPLFYTSFDKWVDELNKVSSQENSKILISISHEMSNTGAPTVLFDFLEVASNKFGVKVFVINCREGDKAIDFIRNFPTILLPQPNEQIRTLLKELNKLENVRILLNTIAHLEWANFLCEEGIDFSVWQHEQKTSWKFFQQSFESILNDAKKILVGSRELQRDLVNYKNEISNKIHYHDYGVKFTITKSRFEIDELLDIKEDTKLILLAGSRSIRKGFDLLPKLADNLSRCIEDNLTYLILWIGDSVSNELDLFVVRDISKLGTSGQVLVCGGLDNYADFFNRADVVVHLAREDTKPQVLMLSSKLDCQIITFTDIGMDSENLKNLSQIEYQDLPNMARRINQLLKTSNKKNELQKGIYDDWEITAVNMIHDLYSEGKDQHVNKGIKIEKNNSTTNKQPNIPVSVIIPNYNHEKFIKERIISILDQKYRPHEIILLDDASEDKSLEIAEAILRNQSIPYQIHPNAVNSGAPISQWAKGVNNAKYPLVWIAESDDRSEPEFLLEAVNSMTKNAAQIYLCESVQIDESGIKTNLMLERNYQFIPCALNADHNNPEVVFQYEKLLRNGMNLRNLFINVSSMVFYKKDISNALNTTLSVKPNRHIADWYAYLNLNKDLIVNFSRSKNNLFRKSQNGLTFSKNSLDNVLMGREEISKFIIKNKESFFSSEIEFESWNIKFKYENIRIGKINK